MTLQGVPQDFKEGEILQKWPSQEDSSHAPTVTNSQCHFLCTLKQSQKSGLQIWLALLRYHNFAAADTAHLAWRRSSLPWLYNAINKAGHNGFIFQVRLSTLKGISSSRGHCSITNWMFSESQTQSPLSTYFTFSCEGIYLLLPVHLVHIY